MEYLDENPMFFVKRELAAPFSLDKTLFRGKTNNEY